MKKYLFFLLLVILTAVVSSCIEDVQLRPQEERDIVLSCILTNKYSQELKLYHSNRLYEDADGDAIDVADVEIELFSHIFGFGKDSSSVGCFVHSGGSIWRLDYTPEPGCSYSIVAKVEGKELYARTLMPDPISRQHVFSSMDVESTFPPRQGRLEFSPKRAPSEQELPNFLWVYGTDNKGGLLPEIFTTYPFVDPFNKTTKYFSAKDNLDNEIRLYYHNQFIRIDTRDDGEELYLKGFSSIKTKYYDSAKRITMLMTMFSSESESIGGITIMNVSS